ncbi:MAG: dihydrofolate reductase [Burkholderiales bacterium]|nr:dihydrofolate reductase [Burkholderiales bacterium]
MSKPKVTIIVARSRNGVIGKDGKLPWKLSEDMKFFKEKTSGKPIVMGRKTWESIGRPLPNRQNIVITKNPDYEAQGAQVVRSLKEAMEVCRAAQEIMVIGGASIYAQALPIADRAWITLIDSNYEGDAFFKELPKEEWELTWTEEHPTDGTSLGFRFQKFERIGHI